MIGMVGMVLAGFAGLLWFVYRKQMKQASAYRPEGKIRWSDQETS